MESPPILIADRAIHRMTVRGRVENRHAACSSS
jgi:hypothetical protein